MIGLSSVTGLLSGGSLSGLAVFHNTIQILMGESSQSMVDVTAAFPPMSMISIHYEDPISFQADTLELVFADIGDQIIKSSNLASQGQNFAPLKKGMWLKVKIDQWNRDYPGSHVQRDLGTFQLDQIKTRWPPTQVTLMATSVPISEGLKLTLENKTWITTGLRDLGEQVARANHLGFVWDVDPNAHASIQTMSQAQQWNESSLTMYARYLKNNAMSMKIKEVNGRQCIVVFDEQSLEKKPPVYTIDFSQPGAGIELTRGELTTQSQDIYSQSQYAQYDPNENALYTAEADAPADSATGSGAVLNTTDKRRALGQDDMATKDD